MPSHPPISPVADFRRIPALDGLRALSIGLVTLSHLGLQRWVPGIFGVNVFFFVSGFLITRLLLAEAAASGAIDVPRFYARRALRLYPALLVAVALGGLGYALLGGGLRASDVAAALLYGANWWELAGGFQSGLAGSGHPYAVLWSLAVEEHFYLLFPLAAAPLLARRASAAPFAWFILGTIAAVTAWRCHVALACTHAACHDMRVLHGTDTRADSILYGAALTAGLATDARATILRVIRSRAAAIAGCVLIAASLTIRDPLFRDTFRFTLQGCGLTLAIGAALFAPALAPVRRALAIGPARAIGRWSYSLYLWHWIVLAAAVQALDPALRGAAMSGGLPPALWPAFALPVACASLAAAALSYSLVERPMTSLRHRFGSHA